MFNNPAKKPNIINEISPIGRLSKKLSINNPIITDTIKAANNSEEIRYAKLKPLRLDSFLLVSFSSFLFFCIFYSFF